MLAAGPELRHITVCLLQDRPLWRVHWTWPPTTGYRPINFLGWVCLFAKRSQGVFRSPNQSWNKSLLLGTGLFFGQVSLLVVNSVALYYREPRDQWQGTCFLRAPVSGTGLWQAAASNFLFISGLVSATHHPWRKKDLSDRQVDRVVARKSLQ